MSSRSQLLSPRSCGTLTLALLSLAACGAPPPQETPENQPAYAAQQELVRGIQPAAARSRLRRTLRPPIDADSAVRYPPYDLRGTAEAAEAAAEEGRIAETTARSGWAPRAEAGKHRVILTDIDAREERELEIDDADLDRVGLAALLRGVADATSGGDAGEGDVTAQGWSNGTDSRVAKPIGAAYPIGHRVLRRMGQINGGCSGTLIGRRLVLTAAHCVVTANLQQVNQTYRARRSGAQAPYGAETTAAYYWDAQYSGNGCHTNYVFGNCVQWDWAILILRQNAWNGSPNGSPGWMGYYVPGEAYLSNNSVAYNDGYPGCGLPESPAGCQANTAYGQNFACNATGWQFPESGHNLYFRVGCDMGRGHSGSALWSDYPGANGPYVLGITIWQHCYTCTDAMGSYKTHPNGYRKMNPWLAGFISDLRVQYP